MPIDRNKPKPHLPSRGKQIQSPQRMRSHREASEAARYKSAPPILDHPLVARNDPTIVTSPSQLRQLIIDLRRAGQFGYDSEFIGEHSYYPKLCVIQVATTNHVTLIDPLSNFDLTPFWDLLTDPSVQKIVHCGTQDLEPAARHLRRPPLSLFDTQIAAAFVGLDYPCSLARLVQTLLGTELGWQMKFTQWDDRPLSTLQLHYAANDVRYLPLLGKIIAENLNNNGNDRWAIDECCTLSDPTHYQFDPDARVMRIRGVETLNSPQLAALRALIVWRDEAAREQDMPTRSLVKDKILMDLCRQPLKSIEMLRTVRGLPQFIKQIYGQAIVEATHVTFSASSGAAKIQAPDQHRHKHCIDSLWVAVQQCCSIRSIDPAIVTTKKQIAQLVNSPISDRPRTNGFARRLLVGWRRELVQPVLGHLLD